MAEREPIVIAFEGFADTEPGWEFDMPVYMIRPVKREGIGGNVGHAEHMVEDYIIDCACGDEPESEDGEWGPVMRQFKKARKGKGRPGRLVYWSCEVKLPGTPPPADDDSDEANAFWDSAAIGPFHYGPIPGTRAHEGGTDR